jgi:hypothetical protein
VGGDTTKVYQEIDGVMTKRCNGQTHKDGPVQLPFDAFYVRRKPGPRQGLPISQCKACVLARKGFVPETSGYVELSRIQFVLDELVSRVGRQETKRLMGYGGASTWTRITKQRRVQKKFAIAAIHALKQLRDNDVVWHRDSIRHGAKARGRVVKRPVDRKHFYNQADDSENEYRRRRRENPDIRQAERDRQNAKRKKEREERAAIHRLIEDDAMVA